MIFILFMFLFLVQQSLVPTATQTTYPSGMTLWILWPQDQELNFFLTTPKPYIECKVLHELIKNPLQSKSNYLCMLWTLPKLHNPEILSKIPEISISNGFTVSGSMSYELILPTLKRLGITVLFCPHLKKSDAYTTKMGIKLIPIAHGIYTDLCPAEKKDIWYSFVGAITHPVRKEILKLTPSNQAVVIEREAFHSRSENKEFEAREYAEVLGRSRFALCPRGVGYSTYRFWESLKAQAIPIIISDDFSLPRGFDWDSCSIQIQEKDVPTIPNILRNISSEKESVMREKCLEAYTLFCGPNIVNPIRWLYEQ